MQVVVVGRGHPTTSPPLALPQPEPVLVVVILRRGGQDVPHPLRLAGPPRRDPAHVHGTGRGRRDRLESGFTRTATPRALTRQVAGLRGLRPSGAPH